MSGSSGIELPVQLGPGLKLWYLKEKREYRKILSDFEGANNKNPSSISVLNRKNKINETKYSSLDCKQRWKEIR